MFKTNGNDVAAVTSYKTLSKHAPQGVRAVNLKLHMITLRMPLTTGRPQGVFKKIYTKGLDSESSGTLCFL